MKKLKLLFLALLASAVTVGATACELPFGIGGGSSDSASESVSESSSLEESNESSSAEESSEEIVSETESSSDEVSSEESSSEENQGPTEEELAAMGAILEQAYALESGATMEGTHTLTGTVTNVAKTGDGEACLTFVVEGYDQYPMYCYWLKGEYAGNLKVGDTITVTGTIKNYNGTVEYDKGNLDAYVVAPELPDDSSSDEGSTDTPATAGEILEQAYALAEGATMAGTHTLTGTVTNVKSTGDGEACLTFVVEGYDQYPMYCYWLKGDAAGTLMVGDIITVTGTIKNYKGTVEYDKPNLDSYEKGERPPLEVTTQLGTGIAEGYEVISLEMATAICEYVGEATTTDRYYIQATIDTVSNAKYGEMYISDATGSMKVYGTYSEDGAIGYANMTEKPVKGAEVLLSCTLHTYKESAEIANARLIAFENVTVDESGYTDMSIADARAAEDGSKVKVDGVVARITYANGFIPNGVYLVDDTDSIYVYDRDLAGRVEIGNNVTILGDKTHWILESETSNAEKFGYKGGNQIEDAWLVSNDGASNEWNKDWVEATTIKTIMDTPVSEDITNTIFKVNALINEAVGTGFTNYYINDLDETTGSYVYTQCNGSDFEWLKEYDNGKVYTVYLAVINAKSSASGCLWRFVPIAVVDDGFVADQADAAKFFVEYYGVGQIESLYYTNPELVLNKKVSSTVYGIEEAYLYFYSENSDIISVDQNLDGDYVLNCVSYGTTNIVVMFDGYGGNYSTKVEVTYEEAPKIDSLTVAEAIATAPDTEVTVKGIVGPSLVNQSGFYLFGEDGSMIAVKVLNKEEAFANLSIGNEVILKGMRERYIKDDTLTQTGQTCIVDAEILQNNFGSHEYSTAKFVTDKTVADLFALDATVDYSTTVFVVTGTLAMPTGNGQPSINADGAYFNFYCSGSGQYAFLNDYVGQEVTIEVAACNWNNKTYWRGCVLAVRTADGKVLNMLNFN